VSRAFEILLKIEGFTPEAIPMGRLAEYMADFAKLLGGDGGVHFVGLERASVGIRARVSEPQSGVVRERVQAVKRREGPADARAAFRSIDERLREDRTYASIVRPTGAQIFQFPGIKAPPAPVFKPVEQDDNLRGHVVGVGGRSKKIADAPEGKGLGVPVYIDTGGPVVVTCHASRDLARDLAHHLFEQPLRFLGRATWVRAPEGGWSLDRFVVRDFEPIEGDTFADIAGALRTIPNDIKEGDDAWSELLRLRAGRLQ
jgi:hypothetical protein